MQVKEVKVCFEDNSKSYSFDCADVYVKMGDKVVVDTARGEEVGTICSKVKKVKEEDLKYPLKKVLRIATEEDINKKKNSDAKGKEIKESCQKIANALKLEMKVISASVNMEASKVVICFTSGDRVDFRELIKELAGMYKMRIELRQVDSREETKILGGLGPCGRECCCSNFLKEAEHSSIKMAKIQGISLNPSSISGLCGKLKCCFAYENEYYSEVFKKMPKLNTEVLTPDGKGLVIYNNLLKQLVSVKFVKNDGAQEIKEYNLTDVKFGGKNE